MPTNNEQISINGYRVQATGNGNFTMFDGHLALVFNEVQYATDAELGLGAYRITLNNDRRFIANFWLQDDESTYNQIKAFIERNKRVKED